MSNELNFTHLQPGPFDIKAANGGIVGTVTVYNGQLNQGTADFILNTPGPFGRDDLRTIAHRLMNIADFDTGLPVQDDKDRPQADKTETKMLISILSDYRVRQIASEIYYGLPALERLVERLNAEEEDKPPEHERSGSANARPFP